MNKLSAISLMLLVCVSVACKKKKNEGPLNVQLRTIEESRAGNTTNYQVFYDAANNVDSISITGNGRLGYKKFGYFSASYTITDERFFAVKADVSASGKIVKVYVPDTLTMVYKSTGNIDELVTRVSIGTYPYYKKISAYYAYADGDITAVTSPGSSDSYDYDKGRSGQQGDPQRIAQFLAYGRSYVNSDHLAKYRIHNSDTAEKYFYEFDGAGRITVMTMLLNYSVSGGRDTVVYRYGY